MVQRLVGDCRRTGVVSHVGSVALRLLADRVGLTEALSVALTRRSFTPVHDRGQVLVDVAVMLADGGETIADIGVLHHQRDVLDAVASAPTVWRALDELTPARLRRIETARARVRRHVWAQLDALPTSRVADADLGATVVFGRGRDAGHRALGQGACRSHVQGRVRLPPDRGVV